MLKKLLEIENKYNEITKKLSEPDIIADQSQYRILARSHSDMQPLADKIKQLKEINQNIEEAQQLKQETTENDLITYFDEEIKKLNTEKSQLEDEIKELIVTRDPDDEKDIIMEIRAGSGGDEAAIFAADLYRMYSRFAENNKFKCDVISSNPIGVGGLKEIIFSIQGKGAYSKFKYESGVHRVQRIPVTESGGRIHTSAATVAVLPEAEDVDVEINHNDIRIDIYRSSGPGGQSVNTTDSAVRITHLPTGLVVSCQDQKSQLQNKEQAMRVLRARLHEKLTLEQQNEISEQRRMQVGTGDRSERIRTYNFPQGRVTDHRIGITLYKLDAIINGEIDELIEQISAYDKSEKLKKASM